MNGSPWTTDEVLALRMLYPTHSAKRIAKLFGRTAKAVHNQATKHRLRRLRGRAKA